MSSVGSWPCLLCQDVGEIKLRIFMISVWTSSNTCDLHTWCFDVRHRMTTSGRREAARTAAVSRVHCFYCEFNWLIRIIVDLNLPSASLVSQVAYRLYDSLYSRRFVRLARLSERLKLAGLGPGETSRMRQYEQKMGECIERLRMIKMYRTSQTLRTFSRIFTIILPPFFAPMYAKLAVKEQSLAVGIFCAVITALCLHALFEGTEILEDVSILPCKISLSPVVCFRC